MGELRCDRKIEVEESVLLTSSNGKYAMMRSQCGAPRVVDSMVKCDKRRFACAPIAYQSIGFYAFSWLYDHRRLDITRPTNGVANATFRRWMDLCEPIDEDDDIVEALPDECRWICALSYFYEFPCRWCTLPLVQNNFMGKSLRSFSLSNNLQMAFIWVRAFATQRREFTFVDDVAFSRAIIFHIDRNKSRKFDGKHLAHWQWMWFILAS